MVRTVPVLAALIPLVLAACDPAADDPDLHVDRLPTLTAEALDRIGDRDDPDIGFSRIAGVDVGPDGNVYVGEAMVPEIRVYSEDGHLLRRIGQRGEGPGEFEGAPRFGVVGDTVWPFNFGPPG